jgi:hypothetical protein
MLVKDGMIEKMFIEPDVPGDPFEISDADTMLAYVAPHAAKPLDVTVFTREGCPFCSRGKGMLREAGIAYDDLVLNRDYGEVTPRAVAGRSARWCRRSSSTASTSAAPMTWNSGSPGGRRPRPDLRRHRRRVGRQPGAPPRLEPIRLWSRRL